MTKSKVITFIAMFAIVLSTFLFFSFPGRSNEHIDTNPAPVNAELNRTPTVEAAKLSATPLPVAATPTALIRPAIKAEPTSTGNNLNDDLFSEGKIIPVPVADLEDEVLLKVILQEINGQAGRYGVGVKNLRTGQTAFVNEQQVFEAASLFKLSVIVETFKKREAGILSFRDTLTVTEKAVSFDLGVYKHEVGEPVTITKALEDMIVLSDNVYANVLLDAVRSWDVNNTMLSYGLTRTDISKEGLTTSPSDILRFYEQLATGRIVNREASQEIIDVLLKQKIRDRIPFLLPEGIRVAHKTGNLEGLSHDAGIVYAPRGAYIIVILSQDLPDELAASKTIAKISQAVYRYFGNNG